MNKKKIKTQIHIKCVCLIERFCARFNISSYSGWNTTSNYFNSIVGLFKKVSKHSS